MIVSGLQGLVVMEEGKTLDEDSVKKALESKKMKLISLEETKMAMPKAIYDVQIKGGT